MNLIRRNKRYKLVGNLLHFIRYKIPNLTDEQKELVESYKFQCDLEEVVEAYDVYSVCDRADGDKSGILMRLTIVPFGVMALILWMLLPIMFVIYGDFRCPESIVNFTSMWWNKIKGR
jgi:hypothetical protein